jgi:small subunit ribosomal protein S18
MDEQVNEGTAPAGTAAEKPAQTPIQPAGERPAPQTTAGTAAPRPAQTSGQPYASTSRPPFRRYGREGRPEGGPPNGDRGRKPYFRRKVCKLCVKKAKDVDYKDMELLRRFVTDRGKILPRRITGTCAKHQRMVSRAIMRARIIALLPYASSR